MSANKGKASGYASLDGNGNVPASQLDNAPTAIDASASTKGVVKLSGDLSGSANSPKVAKVNGVSISGTPSSGQLLKASGSSAAAWSDDTAVQSAQLHPATTLYVQPSTPVSPNPGDLWVPSTQMQPSDIGAEATANKDVANGYMGLDANGRGASPPEFHAATHAPGGTDDTLVFNGNQSTLAIEDMPYFIFNGTSVPVSGTVYFSAFTAQRAQTISNLIVTTGNIGTPNVTAARLQLVTANSDGSVTAVAETANDTSIVTTGSFRVNKQALSGARGLPTSYDIVRGTRYALAVLVVGATIPPLYALSGNPMGDNANITGSSNFTRFVFQAAGQSDIATSYPSGSLTFALGTYFWMAAI
jgi:hypothetical protein